MQDNSKLPKQPMTEAPEETPRSLSWLELDQKIRERLRGYNLQPEKWETKATLEEVVADLKHYTPKDQDAEQ